MFAWTDYHKEVRSLGIPAFFVYKFQNMRARVAPAGQHFSYLSKYARFPLEFRSKTTDPFVFRQIFVEREYMVLDDVRDARLIVDCGANVGYSSAYFLTQFPESNVIAVEPDPDNFSLLERNLAPYQGRFRAICSAVWSNPAPLALSESRMGPCREWARTVREARAGDQRTMMATDIGTLLTESGFDRISILKIDVEGAESIIFSSNYEAWLPRVDNIVVELHGPECRSVFHRAIADQNFEISSSGELVVCKRGR
jgi:FkbM family methyltransferase